MSIIKNDNFVNPGMYSCGVIPVEHRDTYSVFYKEITGKALQGVLISGPTIAGLKRKAQGTSVLSKEEPKVKKQKSNEEVSLKFLL